MGVINQWFLDLLDLVVVVLLDGTLTYLSSIEQHIELLAKIFTGLAKCSIYCKLKYINFYVHLLLVLVLM